MSWMPQDHWDYKTVDFSYLRTMKQDIPCRPFIKLTDTCSTVSTGSFQTVPAPPSGSTSINLTKRLAADSENRIGRVQEDHSRAPAGASAFWPEKTEGESFYYSYLSPVNLVRIFILLYVINSFSGTFVIHLCQWESNKLIIRSLLIIGLKVQIMISDHVGSFKD